jgi:hypothetical protein
MAQAGKAIFRCLSRLVDGFNDLSETDAIEELRKMAIKVLEGHPGDDGFFGFSPPAVMPLERRGSVSARGAANDTVFREAFGQAEQLVGITDVRVISNAKQLPVGYELVAHSFCQQPANINKGNKSGQLYLCFKRGGTKADDAQTPEKPITALSVIHASNHEEPPFGFTVVQSLSGTESEESSVDLNGGAGGTVWLATHRGDGMLARGRRYIHQHTNIHTHTHTHTHK